MKKIKQKLICECGKPTINNSCIQCDFPNVYHHDKSCPKCNNFMELSRYFTCKTCTPELEEDPGDFIYNVENF